MADQEVSDIESIYKAILENATDIIVILNENLEFTYINEKPLKFLFGYEVEELLGNAINNYIHPKDRKQGMKMLNLIFKSGEESSEARFRHKDGHYIWLEIVGRAIKKENNDVRIVLILREISNRKGMKSVVPKSEERFRELCNDLIEIQFWKFLQPKKCLAAVEASQEMLRLVIDNIPQNIFWKDKNSIYLGCNTNFAKLVGYKNPSEVIGLVNDDLKLKNKVMDDLSKKDKEVMKTDRPEYHVIESWHDHLGKLLIIDINRIPLHNARGKVVGILIAFEDITERKEIENKIIESEEKYRNLTELLPDIVYKADLNAKVTYVNPIAFEKFDYTPEDLEKGMYLHQLVDPVEKNKAIENAREILKGNITKPHDYILRKKDGTTFYGSVHSRPIYEDGKVIGMRGIIHDTTEKRNAELKLKASEEKLKLLNKVLEQKVKERTKDLLDSEKKLRKQNLELRRMDELKNDFITMAAHELKTPLISISGYTEYIIMKYKDDLNPEMIEDLSIVQRNITRLRNYMNQLLNVMKIDEEKLKLDIELVNVIDIINKCIQELSYLVKEKNHKLILNYKDEILLNVDKERLFQVFSNLLSNAIKFTHEGGIIEISAKVENRFFSFIIKDNGIGLKESELKHIFQKFEQITRSKEEGFINEKGTGLGLYISKGIIEAHNGIIKVDSKGINEGTSFTFEIPIKKNINK